MPFSRLDMDHDLLGMGSWIDDRAASQPSTTQSQERGSVRHYLPPLAETDRHGSFFKGAEHIESSRGSHESEHSKSEDKLADGTTRDAIGEIRVTQTVTVDGRQRGNKATAKPSRAPSVVERQLLKQARVYLPLDEYEATFGREVSENDYLSFLLNVISCLLTTSTDVPMKKHQKINTTTT